MIIANVQTDSPISANGTIALNKVKQGYADLIVNWIKHSHLPKMKPEVMNFRRPNSGKINSTKIYLELNKN